jgi:hypothetical protein
MRKIFLTAALVLALAVSVSCGSEFANILEGDVIVSPETLVFPQTAIGRSRNVQFELRNNGDGELLVTNIEIVDSSPYITFATSFLTEMALMEDSNGDSLAWHQGVGAQSFDTHPGFLIRPQGAIQIDLDFAPATADLNCPGGITHPCGRIVITSNDRSSPTVSVEITLDQSAGRIAVDDTVMQFPDIVGGPYEDDFTITNEGSGPLRILSVNDPGVPGVSLQEDSNRQEPFTLGVGETSTYNVIFTPQNDHTYCEDFDPEVGCSLGLVQIDSDDALGNSVIVSLQVGGVSVPDICVSTTTLVFDAGVDETDTQTVDVCNEGGAPLTWNLRIDPPGVRDLFELVVDGTSQPAGGSGQTPIPSDNSKTVELTFAPIDESTVVGELVITSNDGDESPLTINLFAGPPAPDLAVEPPAQIYFSDVDPGECVESRFVIINTGRATLNITSGDLSGDTADEFEIDPVLAGESIGVGERLDVIVRYCRAEGDFGSLDHATLTIISNAIDPNDEYRLDLFANHDDLALPPTVVITASPDGNTSVDETITLSAADSIAPPGGELISNPYSWVLLSRPDGSEADLSSDFEETTTLTPDVAGTYQVLLTVTGAVSETVITQGQTTRNLFIEE